MGNVLKKWLRKAVYTYCIRIIFLTILFSLLMASIPAAPALAYHYDMEVDPEEGAIGDEITVTGTSFGYSEDTERRARIIFAKEYAGVGDYIDTDVETYEEVDWAIIEEYEDGSFSSEFTVPDELTDGDNDEYITSGTYYIYVTIRSATIENPYIRARAEFTVTGGVNTKKITSTIKFEKVPLSSIVNHPCSMSEALGTDSHSWGGIPFDIGKEAFWTQYGAASLPVAGTLKTEIPNPQSVHVLINCTEPHLQFQEKQVGIITLVFDNGDTETTELVVGQNVRSYIIDGPTVNTVSSPSNQEVWQGTIPDSRQTMIIDMLTIPIDSSNQKRTLKRIDIVDTSASKTDSTSPGLFVWALTVKYKAVAELSEAPAPKQEVESTAPPPPTITIPPVVEKVIPPAPGPNGIPVWVWGAVIVGAFLIFLAIYFLKLKPPPITVGVVPSTPEAVAAIPGGPEPPMRPRPIAPPISVFPVELADLYYDASLIGEGGFARVFRARRRSDDNEVAVKIPLNMDASTGKSFVREITSWQNLNHRNIVKLYDLNILPIPYLEMELCDSNLDNLNKPLDIERVAHLIFDIAEGLKHAHSKGIIHRDLKPANILLDDDIPKIADWGLSKIAKDSKSTVHSSFTLLYAAPEQISPEKFGKTDNRTDIYQLGTIFYELIADEPPSSGDNATEIMAQIIMGQPKPPSEHNPEAKAIEPIIMKCLEKETSQRYQTVDELQEDLVEYLKTEYKGLLTKSQGDIKRSRYYCSELCMVNLQIKDTPGALKYAMDLRNYANKEAKAMLNQLIEELELRIKEDVPFPEERLDWADVILHQVKMGW